MAATGSDPLVRSQLRGARDTGPAWARDGAVGWVAIDADMQMRYFFVLGTPAAAARLVVDLAEKISSILPTPRISIPRGTPAELAPSYRLENATDWDFRWTATAPPPVPGEDRVQWLSSPVDEVAVAELLAASSPRTSASPGDSDVRRWAGIRGPGGRLDACAADTSGTPGVGHLSGIATRPECRGQGLGRAVTAWVTRQLLSSTWSRSASMPTTRSRCGSTTGSATPRTTTAPAACSHCPKGRHRRGWCVSLRADRRSGYRWRCQSIPRATTV